MYYESNKRAAKKHISEKLDVIKIQPSKEIGAKIRESAKKSGKSLQRYIIDVLLSEIESNDSK